MDPVSRSRCSSHADRPPPRDTATLHEIDAALRRLYRTPERFGLDEVTGAPIPFARLDVLPWARRRADAA